MRERFSEKGVFLWCDKGGQAKTSAGAKRAHHVSIGEVSTTTPPLKTGKTNAFINRKRLPIDRTNA